MRPLHQFQWMQLLASAQPRARRGKLGSSDPLSTVTIVYQNVCLKNRLRSYQQGATVKFDSIQKSQCSQHTVCTHKFAETERLGLSRSRVRDSFPLRNIATLLKRHKSQSVIRMRLSFVFRPRGKEYLEEIFDETIRDTIRNFSWSRNTLKLRLRRAHCNATGLRTDVSLKLLIGGRNHTRWCSRWRWQRRGWS